MRRHVAAAAILLVLSTLLTGPQGGRAAPAPSPAGDVVSRYFADIYVPALEGKAPSEAGLRQFYEQRVAAQSRAQVTEDQFVEYWAERATHAGSIKAMDFTVGSVVQSEGQDQALAPVTVSILHKGIEDNPVLFAILGLACVGAASYGMGCVGGTERSETGIGLYRAIKEGDVWKVVLPDADLAKMRKLAVQVSAKQFTPDVSAADQSIAVRVLGVTLTTEATTFRLAIENAGTDQAALSNTVALATLTDETGRTYRTRILKSQLPTAVDPGSTATGALVFEPVPLTSTALVLSLPDIHAGDAVAAVRLNVALAAAAPQAADYSPIPGEPVLRYVLAIFFASRHVRFDPFAFGDADEVLDGPSERAEDLAALYRGQLADETRRTITERAFVEFSAKHAAAAWSRRLGDGRWYPHIGLSIQIADAVYSDTRDQATVDVSTMWATAPQRYGTDLRSFRIVKEGAAWRLVVPQDLLEEPAVKR